MEPWELGMDSDESSRRAKDDFRFTFFADLAVDVTDLVFVCGMRGDRMLAGASVSRRLVSAMFASIALDHRASECKFLLPSYNNSVTSLFWHVGK
jgi:hypothetical protein